MLCAISGEAPQVPVVSRKSGRVYEKRLIESWIQENGTEPGNGDSLAVEDLLELNTSQIVRPRPPTLTSIPALLAVFQEEWDALALEAYTLQQNLAQARQQLSTALYQNDAAIRVIARLTRERDEAREALAKVQVGSRAVSANGQNGDAMQIDNAPLPSNIIAKIESTQESLMKTRRKRPTPDGWATADAISSYQTTSTTEPLYPGTKFLSVNASGDAVLLGGTDGIAGVYSNSAGEIIQTMTGDGSPITFGVWAGKRAVISTHAGTVKLYDGTTEQASFKSHSGSIRGLTLHPSGSILASVSEDKTYVLYDLDTATVLTQISTDSELLCTQFHPDGHLLAAGGLDGQIKFYDVKSGVLLGQFNTGAPLKSLFFSENGTWVAAANEGSSIVTIWDLRKVGTSDDPIKALETGSLVESLSWDYSAQFLLIGGGGGISVMQYTKSSKEWSEPLKLGVPASAVAWGMAARSLLAVTGEGALSIIS